MITAIVRFSIRFPGIVVALALVLIGYGLYTLYNARLDVFPEFSPTQVVIQTEAPGLSGEMVETHVTQPIENALSGVVGLDVLRSQSIPGLSVVTALFEDGSDIYRNRQVVSERIAALAARMPAGVSPPTITPLTSSASTVFGLGLTSTKRSLTEVRGIADFTVRPHLLAVPGIAEVNVFGGFVREWHIQIEPRKLIAYGMSIDAVLTAARQSTGVISAGYIPGANQRIAIVTEGQAQAPADIGKVLLRESQGQLLRIADVATVTESHAAPISAAAINGVEGVFLMVQGQLGSNTRAVTEATEIALQELAPLLEREQVTLHPKLFRPANFIETAVANIKFDIIVGSVLVVIVLFLFLFDARTAFICATAIPVSLIAAVLVMTAMGVPLNIMVLGGLAIALGEVVDDAIIDTENIFRRLRENRSAAQPRSLRDVVLDASLEVRGSVIYATFVVALVFVPLLTLGTVAGRLFSPLGLAYILAILASLVVAMTLTPALCYLLLTRGKSNAADPPFVRFIKPRYLNGLKRVERSPGRVMALTAALIAVGLGMLPLFAGEFIPSLKEGHYVIHMTAIPGTSEQETLRIGNRVTEQILQVKGVVSVAQWVGRSQNGADTFGPHYSEFEVEVGAVRGAEQSRILREIREILAGMKGAITGVTFSVNTFLTERIEETIAGFPAEMVVNIFGGDLDALDRDAQRIAEIINAVPGARDVQIQAPPGTPQLTIRLRRDRLLSYGFPPRQVLEAVHTAYEGSTVGQVFEKNRTIPVVAILAPELRRSPSEVGDLQLRSANGTLVKLREIADVSIEAGRYKVLHSGGKRIQTVTANVDNRDLDLFAREVRQGIAEEVKLSPGNYLVISGEAEAQVKARTQLILHSILAGIGVFLLLYLAFGRLRNLAITFLNLPFALIGGVIAVLFSGGWVTLGSLVGFVTLFGITLRNSIMLVSHYRYLVETEGLPWNTETMLRGAAERLPSILMTALVTALGLMPLALGSGQPGREIEGPMATIIVGGLVTSTLLNLLILPTILLHFGTFKR